MGDARKETPEPSSGRTLILGLGNDLVSDDGFGPAVAAACRERLAGRTDIVVEEASVAGFHLLDRLAGYERVLIVDVVQTGETSPGTLHELPVERSVAGRTLGGSHQADLRTTLELGRSLAAPLPKSVRLLVAEAEDLLTIREELTPALAAAVPAAVEAIAGWVERGTLEIGHPAPCDAGSSRSSTRFSPAGDVTP